MADIIIRAESLRELCQLRNRQVIPNLTLRAVLLHDITGSGANRRDRIYCFQRHQAVLRWKHSWKGDQWSSFMFFQHPFFSSSPRSLPLTYKLSSYNNSCWTHSAISYGPISLLHFAAKLWVSLLKGCFKPVKGAEEHLAESQLDPDLGWLWGWDKSGHKWKEWMVKGPLGNELIPRGQE